jgi:hypothetical protein
MHALRTVLIDPFLAPAEAFRAVRERPASSGWALLAIGGVAALSVYALLGGASPEWIVSQQLLEVGELKPDELAVTRNALLEVAPYAVHLGAVSQLLVLPIFCALLAAVYLLAERLLGRSRQRYAAWFALAALSMMPLVVNALGLIVLSLLQSGDKPLQLANYASLNALVLGLAPGERGQGLAAALNLYYLWSIALAAIGSRAYTAYSWGRCVLLAALPYLALFGVWAALV